MLLPCLVFFIIWQSGYIVKSEIQIFKEVSEDLPKCIAHIVEKHFTEIGITYVDVSADDDEVLKALNDLHQIGIAVKDIDHQSIVPHQAYVVTARTGKEVLQKLTTLTIDGTWNPLAQFIITIRYLDDDIKEVFTELMRLHVINVIIVNGTIDPDLYTYNPFDNYGCGKRFDDIINYGKCLSSTTDLYPEKMVTGIRNCTFKAILSDWPPMSVNPDENAEHITLPGMEQCTIDFLKQFLDFDVEYNYKDEPEKISMIYDNMTATGSLGLLQANEYDMVIGGMFLTWTRARTFDYLCGHLAMFDELKILVRKSRLVSNKQLIYLEFKFEVWILLVLTLITVICLGIFVFKIKDKGMFIITVVDNLLLHGHVIKARAVVQMFLFFWLLFGFLLNAYYQSSLVSLTTNTPHEYQISKVEDIETYNLKSCLSFEMCSLLKQFEMDIDLKLDCSYKKECDSMITSIEAVIANPEYFTILPYSPYYYNKYRYYHKWGGFKVFEFNEPISKLIYGIMLYKGFPLNKELNLLTLMMNELGLIEKCYKDLFYKMNTIYRVSEKEKIERNVIVPWQILVAGIVLSALTFLCELISVKEFFRINSGSNLPSM